MISIDEYWINILPSENSGRWGITGGITGKWLVFGPTKELHLYQDLLNKLVEEGVFKKIKITRKDPEYDPFPHKECVMCIFTSSDEDEKSEVAERLREIDLNPSIWKSNEVTNEDWQADGKLFLESEIVREKLKLRGDEVPKSARNKTQKLVFISHSNKDRQEAEKICATLESSGIGCWFAKRDVIPGKNYDEEILDGIENSKIIVVLISSHSNLSEHVKREVEIGSSSEKELLPIKLENVQIGKKLRYFLASRQILNVYEESEQLGFAKLVGIVKHFITNNTRP